MTHELAPDDQPWARVNVSRMHCPYCGEQSLVLGYGDQADDPDRVHVYCENLLCRRGEIVILGITGEDVHFRADVTALSAVDYGHVSEQPPEGNILDPDIAMASHEYSLGTTHRRRRPADVDVLPDEIAEQCKALHPGARSYD